MTFSDDSRDEPGKGTPEGQTGADGPDDLDGPDGLGGVDLEAAWRVIVENYGDRPELGSAANEPAEPEPPTDPRSVAAAGLFDRSYLDAHEARGREVSDSWSDEGHFVPPEPPHHRKLVGQKCRNAFKVNDIGDLIYLYYFCKKCMRVFQYSEYTISSV